MKINLKYQGYYFAPDDESFQLLKAEGMPTGQSVTVTVEQWRQRTDQQRKAIQVYCSMLANTFNAAGLDARAVLAALRQGVEIPWTQDRVKDLIWREIQMAILKKKSTASLTPEEVTRVYEVVNRFTADRFGVSLVFPNRYGD